MATAASRRGKNEPVTPAHWLVLLLLLLATVDCIATPVCAQDEAEAIVTVMGYVLASHDCHGVADDRCPADSKCLSTLKLMVRKLPDCASRSTATSQLARLESILTRCTPAPTPMPTRHSATTDQGSGSSSSEAIVEVPDTLTQSATSSLFSSHGAHTRGYVGIALSCVVAVFW